MARLSKIPDRLIEDMMAKRANGESDGKIQAWLKATQEVDCSVSSVTRALNKVSKERAEVARAVYKNAVANSADQDIKIIDEMIKNLSVECGNAIKEGDRQGIKHMSDALHKWIQTRMDLSGINKPDTVQVDDHTMQLLLDRIGDVHETNESNDFNELDNDEEVTENSISAN